MHAELVGDLVEGEQSAGAESVGVAGQAGVSPDAEHDPRVERLAGPGAVAGGVELLGGLGVGVVVEELVEQSDRVGIGLALLPCSAWQGKADGGVLPAAESDVEVDLIGLVDRDVVYQ